MQPALISLPSLTLLGLSFYGDPFGPGDAWSEENQIGRLWVRFMQYLHSHGNRLPPLLSPGASYEVHIYGDETSEKGLFEIFVGMEIGDVQQAPLDLLVKILPASDYAVFTFAGQEIVSDWNLHVDEGLALAGVVRSHPYSFQRYDERFKNLGDGLAESILDVYMPVQKAP